MEQITRDEWSGNFYWREIISDSVQFGSSGTLGMTLQGPENLGGGCKVNTKANLYIFVGYNGDGDTISLYFGAYSWQNRCDC